MSDLDRAPGPRDVAAALAVFVVLPVALAFVAVGLYMTAVPR